MVLCCQDERFMWPIYDFMWSDEVLCDQDNFLRGLDYFLRGEDIFLCDQDDVLCDQDHCLCFFFLFFFTNIFIYKPHIRTFILAYKLFIITNNTNTNW